jgi:hypothetical protein
VLDCGRLGRRITRRDETILVETVAETSNGIIDIVVSIKKSQLMTMTRGAGGTIPVVNIMGMGFMWYRQVEMQRSLEEMQQALAT